MSIKSWISAPEAQIRLAIFLHLEPLSRSLLELYLWYSPDLTLVDSCKQTVPHLASSRGSTSIVKLLIDSGANTEDKDVNEMTPLYLAAQKDIVNVAIILITRFWNRHRSER